MNNKKYKSILVTVVNILAIIGWSIGLIALGYTLYVVYL